MACFVPYICYNKTIKRKTKQNERKKKQMKTYKIYVDGMYVGTDEFSTEEVRALNNAEGIVLTLA